MLRPSTILFLVCLCTALPYASVTAAPAIGGAAFGNMVRATYPHYRYGPYNRGYVRPYSRQFHHHGPRYYVPYGPHHRFQRPRPRHQRYFGLHGYWAPPWRAPNTLRFYRRYH